MCKDIEAMIKLGKETNAGAVKSIAKKKDGTPIRVICVYFECDELDDLEEKHGFGK